MPVSIKSPSEIEKMRVAGRATGMVLDRLSSFIKPGISTLEIDQLAANFIAETGGISAFLNYPYSKDKRKNFPRNICISLNEEVVHGIGSSRVLLSGDIVKLDVGVIIDGWIGDSAATFPCGIIDPKVAHLCYSTSRILYGALKLVRPNNYIGDIGNYIETEAIKCGLSVVREFVGHGVGNKLHEDPQIPNFGSPKTGVKLLPGMTLAIEPMINLGKPGVCILSDGWTIVTQDSLPSSHFEHTVLVTEGYPEILTLIKK